jgi:diaminopimelate decarboxylase
VALGSSSTTTGAAELARIGGAEDCLSVDGSGILAVDGCSATDLLEHYGSPLYVISESALRRNFRAIRDAFTKRWRAPVTVHYALKSNNNFAVRAILHEEGAGGDCFGEGELYATFVGGADPKKIVMNGSNKSEQELRKAIQLGICINIDAEDEIDFIDRIADEGNVRARVGLRLAVIPERFDPLGTVAAYPWGFSQDSAIPYVKRLQDDVRVEFEGYSMHVGRMSADPAFFSEWAAQLGDVIVALHAATGFWPSRVDVGGGFPRRRDVEAGHDPETLPRNYLNPHTIEEYADAVTTALTERLGRRPLPLPELAIEPGRYIVGSASTLLTTVGAIKSHSGNTWVNVDASINNVMMRETRDYEYWVLPASRMQDKFECRCFVNGPICTGKPLGRNTALPLMQRGDVLAILDAGMYSETLSTQMNGVPRPATVLVRDGQPEIIKERETVNDVFARFRLPERFRSTR